MEICELCERKVKRTEGTDFVGAYCIECHRLNRASSLAAIKRIQGKVIKKSQREQEADAIFEQLRNEKHEPFDTSRLFGERK